MVEAIMRLWAVIPSCCRCPEVSQLIRQLIADGVEVVVIDTGYESPWEDLPGLVVLQDREQPKNISRWWNAGLEFISGYESLDDDEYVVAVLNDDIVIESQFVQRLAQAIMKHDVAAAFPDVYGVGIDYVLNERSGWRMSGFAFALRGSKGLRADESLVWWYGDNDLEYQALRDGGIVLVGGLTLQHLYPNSTTVGELAKQAGRDRETFVAKWGGAPW